VWASTPVSRSPVTGIPKIYLNLSRKNWYNTGKCVFYTLMWVTKGQVWPYGTPCVQWLRGVITRATIARGLEELKKVMVDHEAREIVTGLPKDLGQHR
jgi:hypothetical protein